jgi:cytochrome c peroxidase
MLSKHSGISARAAYRPLLLMTLLSSVIAAQDSSPVQLREFIGRQVGGINRLQVPANNAELPQPRLKNGQPDPLFQTTEAKRYLGKMLFFDPVRTVRIRPEFGGLPFTASTASCGSCHLGEAAGKAGTLFNFAVGGEGRGYTDESGNFIPRRRPRSDIPTLRSTPLFEGDTLHDAIPTLTDLFEFAVGSPARGNKLPPPGRLRGTGRLDALDSVARNAPGIIGAGFNNRLLLGGFAGEPDEAPGGLNPFAFPAQESVALLLLDAHRMLEDQSATLQRIPTFVRLFRDAFPQEAARADAARDLNILINDITVLRATATFLRTAVTRNSPWDRFLAGENSALTQAQRRGARLFFTSAREGGAGCYSCHSGPMLNKQVDDPDVTGAGRFIEENFFNLGLADHPLQALNRVARNQPQFRDDGRKEITGRDDHAFKFRTLTLRQLRDSRFFFHNGSFTQVRDVVEYFNRGIPQDAFAAAAGTLTDRFTQPRGAGAAPGLGLNATQVDDLTEFLENALFDPASVTFNPNSTTDTLEPNERDLTYSRFRPELAALGAVDGRMPSGLPRSNNDPLSRRDAGLEFLDVRPQLNLALQSSNRTGVTQEDVYRITNTSTTMVDTHLLLVANGLPDRVQMLNANGMSSTGSPYLRLFLADGVLKPNQSINVTLRFRRQSNNAPQVSYVLTPLSGQGNP